MLPKCWVFKMLTCQTIVPLLTGIYCLKISLTTLQLKILKPHTPTKEVRLTKNLLILAVWLANQAISSCFLKKQPNLQLMEISQIIFPLLPTWSLVVFQFHFVRKVVGLITVPNVTIMQYIKLFKMETDQKQIIQIVQYTILIYNVRQ